MATGGSASPPQGVEQPKAKANSGKLPQQVPNEASKGSTWPLAIITKFGNVTKHSGMVPITKPYGTSK